MQTETTHSRRATISWAFYDWANSAYATAVMAGFFPIFYGAHWRKDIAPVTSTNELLIASSIASIFMAILAPLLGAVADRGAAKKKFLASFAFFGIVTTAALCFIAQDKGHLALVIYAFSLLGFSGANIFYDSLLVTVSSKEKSDFVSALGYSMGYLGGGILFALNVWMVQSPTTFGISSQETAIRIAFLTVGVWWLLFSVPIFMFVREHATAVPLPLAKSVRAGLHQVVQTFHEIRALRPVFIFLIGYWLYIDGVNTVMRVATKYGQALGFESGILIKALLLVQFVGFPAAIVFGKIGERIGTRHGIYIGLAVYAGVTLFASMMQTPGHFYVLAITVGLVQGGVQALSRSYFSRLIPRDKAGEFFGFYNMVGKFATVLGPIIMIGIAWLTESLGGESTRATRFSILGLILLFLSGAWLISRAKQEQSVSA